MKQATSCLFLLLGLAILTAGCVQPSSQAMPPRPTEPAEIAATPVPIDLTQDTILYQVVQHLAVVNEGTGRPSKQNVWVALIHDVEPYQDVLAMDISPGDYTITVDEYGNQYAEFDLAEMPPGATVDIRISYRVAVHRVAADLSSCTGELPDVFTDPELHVESANPQIVELAQQLSQDRQTACQQVEAFYQHVADNLVYTYNGRDWGAQAALGEMGADCTEYASLMMALSRAAGIPARYLEGLYYAPGDPQALARMEHSWLEVYLPGSGWTPMDPTLGRSSFTRSTYFAAMPANHIIVSRGRNPSALRGASYWTHLYWPGDSTTIRVREFGWDLQPIQP